MIKPIFRRNGSKITQDGLGHVHKRKACSSINVQSLRASGGGGQQDDRVRVPGAAEDHQRDGRHGGGHWVGDAALRRRGPPAARPAVGLPREHRAPQQQSGHRQRSGTIRFFCISHFDDKSLVVMLLLLVSHF